MSSGVEELRVLLTGIEGVRSVVVIAPTADQPHIPANYVGFMALHTLAGEELATGLYRSPEFVADPANHLFFFGDMKDAIEARRAEASSSE